MILEMESRTDLIAHEDNINIQQHLVDVKKKKNHDLLLERIWLHKSHKKHHIPVCSLILL